MLLNENELSVSPISEQSKSLKEISPSQKQRRIIQKQQRLEKQKMLVATKRAQLLRTMKEEGEEVWRQSFDEATFGPAFLSDVKLATALIIIQSPYIYPQRVRMYLGAFWDCIRRGVRICIFIEKRELSPKEASQQLEAVNLLLKIGVHVNFRDFIHEKVVIVDDLIVWSGSLNILSYNGKKGEEIDREYGAHHVRKAILRFKLYMCETCVSQVGQQQLFFHNVDEQAKLLGRQIAKARDDMNISQYQLAKLACTTQTLISELEAGVRNVGLFVILEICIILEIELWCLSEFLVPSVAQLRRRFLDRAFPKTLGVDDAAARLKKQQGTLAQPSTSGHPQT